MTVRFKCQSEYQKSFSVPRSRSVSPQCCVPFAGLDSSQMGICREPGLQHRKRPSSLGAARSCSSRFCPAHDAAVIADRRAPTAASRNHPANMKKRSPNAKAPLPPGSPAVPDTPVGPRPAADTRTQGTPDSKSAVRPATGAEAGKPRPSELGSQSQPSRTVNGEAPTEQQQPSAHQADLTPTRNVGLRSRGQRSEYSRQFGWKKPAPAASPLLTAEQALFSNNRSVPQFKIHPVSVETEYKESFRGLAQPTGPHPWKHVEHQRLPPFHKELAHSGKEAEHTKDKPPQVYKRCRTLTEYQSSFRSDFYRNPEGGGATDDFTQQVRELRQQAQLYRRRAWGTNFCRNHLSQLLSEHTAVWEPTDTTDSTPHLNDDFSPEPDSCSTSCVEALDLASNFSRKSSVVGSGETKASTASPGDQHTAWEEEQDEEKENTDEEEGRLPTPRLKTKPVQRTHHDLTTPATGGAVLVGKLKSTDDFSPNKQLISGTTVTMTTGAERSPHRLTKHKEAWSENKATYSSPSPKHEPAFHPQSKPMRMKQAAPPILTSSPQHVIQGTLRHPDFQHNGELGLRFLPFSRGGCSADEDDCLSVLSWKSAASCSAASTILERAQKRRESFWGKR
nr:nuclear protein MDM1 isoform X1 [Nothobranchius furzeri]